MPRLVGRPSKAPLAVSFGAATLLVLLYLLELRGAVDFVPGIGR
jgi:hypothetical protein